jgi:hypothetical protein
LGALLRLSLPAAIVTAIVVDPVAVPQQEQTRAARPVVAACWREKTLVLLLAIAPLFAWLVWRPMWHTDLWGHLAYGRWMWTHGRIPAHEVFLRWNPDAPLIDTAWLSQWLGYAAWQEGGIAAIQLVFAALVSAPLVALGIGLLRRTGRLLPALIGAATYAGLEWRQWTVAEAPICGLIRPQLTGALCFVLLFVFLQVRKLRFTTGCWAALLFVVWANLHGSFVMGLVLVVCMILGRAADLLRRTESIRSIQRDRRLRILLVILGAGLLGTLANPYGWRLYGEVLVYNRNSNLNSLIEWQPLRIEQLQGQAAACVALALAIAYRASPRRVQSAELLLLATLGGWTLWTSRIIVWWSVPAAWYLALHADAAWRRSIRGRESRSILRLLDRIPLPPRRVLSLLAAAAWIVSIGISPWGLQSLRVLQRPLASAVSQGTPLGATGYLREHPPQGLVFDAFEWGDYFLWAGPPEIELFADSHVHLVPHKTWYDYLRIAGGASSAARLLDEYHIELIVIDRELQPYLIQRLQTNTKWKIVYEDARARIYARQ